MMKLTKKIDPGAAVVEGDNTSDDPAKKSYEVSLLRLKFLYL